MRQQAPVDERHARAVGERVRLAREAAGLSQRDLAFPGCSPGYISRIEQGKRTPSLELLRALAERLGTSEEFLATGAEESVERARLRDAEIALSLDLLEEAEAAFEELVASARSPAVQVGARAGLGEVAMRRGEPRLAVLRFEEALARGGGEPSEHPRLAESLGRAYGQLGEYAAAIALFERCLERFHELGDRIESVRFACLLAYALMDTGNFGRAEEAVARALADGRGIEDVTARIRLYWVQSKLRGERGQSEPAAEYAERALALLRLTEDEHYVAIARLLLASIELDRGRAEEALPLLEAARPALDTRGSAIEQAKLQVEESRALAALGRREEAEALVREALARLGHADPSDAARLQITLGDIRAAEGDRAAAEQLYRVAAERLAAIGPSLYLLDAYGKLGDLLDAAGRRDEAYEYMKRAVATQRALMLARSEEPAPVGRGVRRGKGEEGPEPP